MGSGGVLGSGTLIVNCSELTLRSIPFWWGWELGGGCNLQWLTIC